MSLPTQGNVTQDPILQGSCLDEGEWYLCSAQSPRFLGCCTSDPCNSKGCPKNDLRSASLGAGPGPDSCENDSSLFPNVACPAGSQWYTCLHTIPSFQGCCSVNPCQVGSCPVEYLYPASFVNKNLPPEVSERCSATTTASPTKATAVPSTSAPASSASGFPNSKGAIVGLTLLGAFSLIFLLTLAGFCWYRTKKSRVWHMRTHFDPTNKTSEPEAYRPPMFAASLPADISKVYHAPKGNYQHLNNTVPATSPNGAPIHEIGSSQSSPRDGFDVQNNSGTSRSPERCPYRSSNISNMSDTTACGSQNQWSHDTYFR